MKTQQNTIQEYLISMTDRSEQAGDDKLAFAVDQFSKLLNLCELPSEMLCYMKSYMANVADVATNELYWDCECKERYIHKKSDHLSCPVCGSEEQDSPDSRIQELTKSNMF